MRMITRDDIELWGRSHEAKGHLPALLARLVKEVAPKSTTVRFPSGSAVNIGGWDGKVISFESVGFVPEGISLWEIGAERNPKKKAEKDYSERTADPLGETPSQSTFVFVTPFYWKGKETWVREKTSEKIWKEVRVYDSIDLEQWLDEGIVTSFGFASDIKNYPSDGIVTIERFWKEWALSPDTKLLPDILTEGRDYEKSQLIGFFKGEPSLKSIKSASKDESIAFIIAVAMQMEEQAKKMFFSKSLIIESVSSFRNISSRKNPMFLIPNFEELKVSYAAVTDGHHVLVPLGPDDDFKQEVITLPVINKDGMMNALIKMGIDNETANRLSKESARNITILKRLLKFPFAKYKWESIEFMEEFLPVMLLGRWDENHIGDIELVENLSGEEYPKFIKKLVKWKEIENAPILNIGTKWRLTAPLDLWTNYSYSITADDFNKFRSAFLFAFAQGNPPVDSNRKIVKSNPPYLQGEAKFSNWSREGLLQSLILIGLYGKNIGITGITDTQLWVDNIILNLLKNADGNLWKSFDNEMPLIAEASPESFIKVLKTSLFEDSNPIIMEVFNEEPSFLRQESYYTGILWALESLAWFPDYFRDACLILGRMATLDPGGTLSNRPENSLKEIFNPWHYQTLASFELRMSVLEELVNNEPEIGWTLLKRMLPVYQAYANFTHKFRWRILGLNSNLSYNHLETVKTYNHVSDLILLAFDETEEKYTDLIKELSRFFEDKREIVLSVLNETAHKVEHTRNLAWQYIRGILFDYRSERNNRMHFKESDIKSLENLYDKLTPADVFEKNKWLFDEVYPKLPEGIKREVESSRDTQYEKQQAIIEKYRQVAINEIFDFGGLDKLFEFVNIVKLPFILGEAISYTENVVLNEKLISKFLCGTANHHFAIRGYFRQKYLSKRIDLEYIVKYAEKLSSLKIDDEKIANIFLSINPSEELWASIEKTSANLFDVYWQKVDVFIGHLKGNELTYALTKLSEQNRFFFAIDLCSRNTDKNIPGDLIYSILYKAATEQSMDNQEIISHYYIIDLIEKIREDDSIDHSKLVQLEWLYLDLFDYQSDSASPQILHDEMSRNPTFFIEVLKYAFIPDNEELKKKELKEISMDQRQRKAEKAFKLLYSWKTIPGNNKGIIDSSFLNQWVDETRRMAKSVSRLDIADSKIGKVLAHYPEKTEDWPPKDICELIERINTSSLKSNFSIELSNKRGFSWRGPYDGGDIERKHAKYFEDLHGKHKVKHPNLAQIFKELSNRYLFDAKQMDEHAKIDDLER